MVLKKLLTQSHRESTPDLPPTEKVKLFNINLVLGHHTDYATITILCTASMDPPITATQTRFFPPSASPHTSIWN